MPDRTHGAITKPHCAGKNARGTLRRQCRHCAKEPATLDVRGPGDRLPRGLQRGLESGRGGAPVGVDDAPPAHGCFSQCLWALPRAVALLVGGGKRRPRAKRAFPWRSAGVCDFVSDWL